MSNKKTSKIRRTRKPADEINLSDSCWYLNRELSWLEFNSRVLHLQACAAVDQYPEVCG